MTLPTDKTNDPAGLAKAVTTVPRSSASTGYLSPRYAESLAEFGEPLELPQCGAWLLERSIAGSTRRDAMGCYPLFSCRDWSKLRDDIDRLAGRLLTLALVVDPFSPLTANELAAGFDRVIPFKDHFVVDLAVPSERHVTTHHRHYARKSLRKIKVQAVSDPPRHLEEWVSLYATLIERHQLRGLKAFSRESFRRQLEVPGMVMFLGTLGDQIVGAHLWYVQGEVAYSHLSATSDIGYGCRATYGIYWTAIETFKERFSGSVRWLNLGAGAGVGGDGKDGLTEFKSGWATSTKPAFFCGKIFDRPAYEEMSRGVSAEQAGYFPAYRCGEFS